MFGGHEFPEYFLRGGDRTKVCLGKLGFDRVEGLLGIIQKTSSIEACQGRAATHGTLIFSRADELVIQLAV